MLPTSPTLDSPNSVVQLFIHEVNILHPRSRHFLSPVRRYLRSVHHHQLQASLQDLLNPSLHVEHALRRLRSPDINPIRALRPGRNPPQNLLLQVVGLAPIAVPAQLDSDILPRPWLVSAEKVDDFWLESGSRRGALPRTCQHTVPRNIATSHSLPSNMSSSNVLHTPYASTKSD